MRNAFFGILLLAAAAAPAAARSPRAQVDTSDFAVEVCTSTTIDIAGSGGTATNIINSSVFLSSATFIEVYNVDTDKIHCGFESNVSVTSSAAAYGREILGRIGLGLRLNIDKFAGYWCLSSQVYSVRATITKCK